MSPPRFRGGVGSGRADAAKPRPEVRFEVSASRATLPLRGAHRVNLGGWIVVRHCTSMRRIRGPAPTVKRIPLVEQACRAVGEFLKNAGPEDRSLALEALQIAVRATTTGA